MTRTSSIGATAALVVAASFLSDGRGARAQALPPLLVHEAGSPGGAGASGGTGHTARFDGPAGVATDGKGTLVVSEAGGLTIRKITTSGVVSLLAGRAGIPGSVDDTGQSAAFDTPLGVTIDSAGVTWVADSGNHTIRRVTSGGAVTTIAGTSGQAGSADGTGAAARFRHPSAIAVDGTGTLFVADTANHIIRKVTPAGVVTTLAGSAGVRGDADGTGSAARFSSPAGIAVDSSGTLYVADTDNHLVRRLTQAGVVTTLAGLSGEPGTADGAAGTATLAWPKGIAVGAEGNVYVTEPWTHVLKRITPQGRVTTIAGLTDQPGSADGTHAGARFFGPYGLAYDASGMLYVADGGNHVIRAVTLAGEVTTLAGLPAARGWRDGIGAEATFRLPTGTAIDAGGTLYVADTDSHVIRKVSPSGQVTTLAGLGGTPGTADGVGSAARFNRPMGLVLTLAGDLLVADSENHAVRKVTMAGVVSTFAGSPGTPGTANGTGTAARFYRPAGLARDSAGTVYVAEAWNHTIRRITTAGAVTTRAGTAGVSGSADGNGTSASFAFPSAVIVNAAGDVFVADTGNATIRKITAAGAVSTIAGRAGVVGRADGVGTNARFNVPLALAFDASNQLLVGDTGKLRRVGSSNDVYTVLGVGAPQGTDDGVGTVARLGQVGGLAVSASGVIFIADTSNGCIRRATSTTATLPKVTAVTPPSGGMVGGTLLTVTGANFLANDLSVKLGGVALTDVSVVNGTTLTGRVPAGSQGARDLELTTVMGRATLSRAFTYDRHACYLAEGATISNFAVELALLNPYPTAAPTTLRFLKGDGTTVTSTLTVAAHSRATVWPANLSGLGKAEFSTAVESDRPLVVDRTMTWGGGFGSHAETAVLSPAPVWYLAEGATHSGFDLFYLIQNPNPTEARVEVTYLLPNGTPPIVETHVVAANSRYNIWVDAVPALSNTDVSGVLQSTNGVPIIVERAMYYFSPGRPFDAGHNSAGVTAPARRWFLAEGATGSYFDLFILIANPGDTDAEVEARYLLADGTIVTKTYRVAAKSRYNIWVDLEEIPEGSGQYPLADVAVSTALRSLNDVPVVVERSMWWPQAGWFEAHNSPGATETGTMWGLAAGETSTDARAADTFILIANTSPFEGLVNVTLYFEDDSSATRTYRVPPNSRTNSWARSDFPEAVGRRFGAVVESLVPEGAAEAAQIVVERAMYSNAGGVSWAAGTNARAARIR